MRQFFIDKEGKEYECFNGNDAKEETSYKLVNCSDCGFVMCWDMTEFPNGEDLHCSACNPDSWVEHS